MSDWRPTTWGDEVELRYGKALIGYKDRTSGYPVYGTNGQVGWHSDTLAEGPGIILGRKGAYRGVHYSPNPFYVIDTAYYVIPKSDLDMRWLFYAIQYHKLGEIDDGSPIPSTTRDAVYVRPFDVPSPNEQKTIANVLSSLDDKIELNRRMNATLEAMAQAIFRDWFVDFGPVRRKLDGATDPVAILGGLVTDAEQAARTAALFPESFGDDGLPEGWEQKPLDEVADFLNGLALQKYPAEGGKPSLPVIKIAELRNGITEKSNRASFDVPTKYIIQNGDFIFSWSGSLMAKFWNEGEGALNQHLFKVTSEWYPSWFYSEWVHFHLTEFQRIAASKAVTMGHIKRSHLTEAITNCPPVNMIPQLHAVIDPLIQKQLQNGLENRTLAETRDYLLPRLMSGQVRVAGAEKPVEAVA